MKHIIIRFFWGDGSSDSGQTGSAVHTYTDVGTYTVSIMGTFPRIYFNGGVDSEKIIAINQWGTGQWTSMDNAFRGATRLVGQASDTPDLSAVTSMVGMFADNHVFNQDIGDWDVSSVTNMNAVFYRAVLFNQDIGDWDMSNVTNMNNMFSSANAFNQDIGDWDVSSVSNMAWMFAISSAFNQDISRWDVSSVTNMSGMFAQADAFNQDIGDWDVRNVTNMRSMFSLADAFNQDIGDWDVRNVSNMRSMFSLADAFSQNLGHWYITDEALGSDGILTVGDTARAGEIATFTAQNAYLRTHNPEYTLSGTDSDAFMLNDGVLTIKERPASGKTSYAISIASTATNSYGLNNQRDLTITVNEATSADHFITTWRTTQANESITIPTHPDETYNYTVFWGDGSSDSGQTGSAVHTYTDVGTYTVSIMGTFPRIYFNGGVDSEKIIAINQWGTGQWTSMDNAFRGATRLVGQASDTPDLSAVTSMVGMFADNHVFNQDIGDWDVSSVTNMNAVFYRAVLFNQDIGDWDMSNVTNMNNMFSNANAFNQDIGDWDVSSVTNMQAMFYRAALFDQDIGDWDVSSVSNMAWMFAYSSFNQNISRWDVSSVTHMLSMFYRSALFNQDIGDWDVSSVTNMSGMFSQADAFNQDVGDWDVSSVSSMAWMFAYSSFNQNISRWDVSSVTNMTAMFYRSALFNQDIGDWDVSSVTNMNGVFYRSVLFNQDIGDWDVRNVTNMNNMFSSADAFNQDIGDWDVRNVTNMNNMFSSADAFSQNLGRWYITDEALGSDGILTVGDTARAGEIATFTAQNAYLRTHNPEYTLSGTDSDAFMLNDGVLTIKERLASGKTSYAIRIASTATNGYGLNNQRDLTITVNEATSADNFITTWRTTQANESITIPTHPDEAYNYTVFWGDGSSDSGQTGSAVHTYTDVGTYTVSIMGTFPRIYFNGGVDSEKIIAINQWGTGQWTSMDNAFRGATRLVGQASDTPDLSAVTSMVAMFADSRVFNQDIGDWDVSSVTNMNAVFYRAVLFNQDIGDWDVRNVTNMNNMFSSANTFNQNLGRWYITDATLATTATLPADLTFSIDYSTAVVGHVVATLAAQNAILDGQNPAYALSESDASFFSLTDGVLTISSVLPPAQLEYNIRISATGSNLFESNNNNRTLTITVNAVAPIISISPDVVTATVGTAIADITIDSTGDTASYGISPTLTAGLTLDTATGTISGTPTEAAGSITYVITATNSAGSDTDTVAITFVAKEVTETFQPPGTATETIIVVDSDTGTMTVTAVPRTIVVTVASGGTATISGITVTAVSMTALITIVQRAFEQGGIDTATLTQELIDSTVLPTLRVSTVVDISVNEDECPMNGCKVTLSYQESDEVTDGDLYLFHYNEAGSKWEALPHVSRDTSKRTVTALASSFSPFGLFAVASNILLAAPDINISTDTLVATVGIAITDITIDADAGGAVASYSISPTLTAGLTLDTATGTISGTPTEAAGSITYTITATNSGGSATATVAITVTDIVAETPVFTLDVDGARGITVADGIMITRYLSRNRGASLTANQSRSPPEVVEANIQRGINSGVLDVDGARGITVADGIMIARYLSRNRGASLTANQSRSPPEVVEANIEN